MDLTLSDEQRLLRESVDRFVAETYDADHRRRGRGRSARLQRRDLEAVRRSRLAGAADRGGLWRARRRRGRDRHRDGSVRARAGLRALSRHRGDRRRADLGMRQRGAEAGDAAQDRRRFAVSGVRAFGTAARFDLADVETTATKTPDGWRLDGHKTAVLDGHAAGQIIVSARVDDGNGQPGKLVPVPGAGRQRRPRHARLSAARRRPRLQSRSRRMFSFPPTPCSATAAMPCRRSKR